MVVGALAVGGTLGASSGPICDPEPERCGGCAMAQERDAGSGGGRYRLLKCDLEMGDADRKGAAARRQRAVGGPVVVQSATSPLGAPDRRLPPPFQLRRHRTGSDGRRPSPRWCGSSPSPARRCRRRWASSCWWRRWWTRRRAGGGCVPRRAAGQRQPPEVQRLRAWLARYLDDADHELLYHLSPHGLDDRATPHV